jgi:hypothetical protein
MEDCSAPQHGEADCIGLVHISHATISSTGNYFQYHFLQHTTNLILV